MSVDFRGNPLFPEGFNNPTRFEADVYDCEVWGNIPSDIEGTFFRMQCDYEYPPPHNDWMTGFNGDGHISSLVFKNGHVDFKARYVKTDRIMAERKARKRLFGVYRNPFTDDPSVKNVDRGTANTHMYWHGGKLLVLKEDSLPYIVDPHTLETKGVWDFHGKWKSQTMSAHPKIDPVSGEMIAYGYQAKGLLTDDVAYYIIGKDGRVKKEVWFKAPYIGIMHDQAITQKHIALPLIPMTSSMDRLKAGNPMWTWDGSLPTMVAIMPRDGDAKDVRWFKGPSRMTLHFLNATTVGNKVVMELPCNDSQRSPSQIKRWTFDLDSKDDRIQEEVVSTANGFLARMDDRYLSLPYKYCYVQNRDPSKPGDEKRAGRGIQRAINTYQSLDVHTGKAEAFYVGAVQNLQEPCFVPRKGGTAEGDGYIMGVASNYESTSSDLVIVDAQRMSEGAIATVKLPFRLRSGTHTNWFSSTDLPLQV